MTGDSHTSHQPAPRPEEGASQPSGVRLNIVLYQPEIPQNTGNVSRTCVAVGAKLWLVRPLGFRLDNRYLKRAGLDYWPHLDWEVIDAWSELARSVPADRIWYFSKSAERRYTDVAYEPGDYLVFGSETRGLPRDLWQSAGEQALRIPISEHVRSLNLSNSVAIAAYEALRQWDAS